MNPEIPEIISGRKPNQIPYLNIFPSPMLEGMEWHDRLNEALSNKNWSVPDLARHMGYADDDAVVNRLYKYTNGEVKNPRGNWMALLAKAIGETEQFLRYGTREGQRSTTQRKGIPGVISAGPIHIQGEVAAGVWRSTDGSDGTAFEESPLLPDPRYPPEAQFDLIVRGTSINRFARDGDVIRVVKIEFHEPNENDLVVVERQNGSVIETTAKRLRRHTQPPELRPDSDDPSWQPIPLKGDAEVRIIGTVIYAYRKA